MEKQHLTYFKIENFKRFDSFEMENLGHFNLIVGDNNIGKTSVLESLLFDEDFNKFLDNIYGALNRRYGVSPISYKEDPARDIFRIEQILNKKSNPITFHYRTVDKLSNNSIKLQFLNESQLSKKDINYIKTDTLFNKSASDKFWVRYLKNDKYQGVHLMQEKNSIISPLDKYMPYIPMNLGYDSDMVSFYFKNVNANKENREHINSLLRGLIPLLEDIRVHQFEAGRDTLAITLSNDIYIYPLARFGEGTVKLCRILLEIIMTSGGRLMIDEIDNGIHFLRLKDYWKTIIGLCIEFKVQLFATTHSLECQQAFIEALEDPEMQQYQKEARNISLIENKQGVVEAITYDFEQFEYALNIGFNTRGGKA